MAEIVPNVKTGKKNDIDDIIRFDLNDNNAKIVNSVISFKLKREKRERRGKGDAVGWILRFSERVFLLSRNTRDPTVGSLRDNKGSCSTWSKLRVDTGFEEF